MHLAAFQKRSGVKKPDPAGWNCSARMGDNPFGIYRFLPIIFLAFYHFISQYSTQMAGFEIKR